MSEYAMTRSTKDKSDNVGRVLVVAYLILFLCFMIFPLFALMSKSMQNADGAFVGLANFVAYLNEPTSVSYTHLTLPTI